MIVIVVLLWGNLITNVGGSNEWITHLQFVFVIQISNLFQAESDWASLQEKRWGEVVGDEDQEASPKYDFDISITIAIIVTIIIPIIVSIIASIAIIMVTFKYLVTIIPPGSTLIH